MILTDENFEKEIAGAKLPVLVDFYADWCGPCQVLGPILEKIEREMSAEGGSASGGKFILAKVNVEKAPEASQKFGAERIPTVILFKNGQAASGFVGLASENDIKNWLNSHLE